MAKWVLFEPRGGILRWEERNDSIVNNGEDFVCYSFTPVEINLDVIVGEVEVISLADYKKECPCLRYLGE